jgi:hypothetical protein
MKLKSLQHWARRFVAMADFPAQLAQITAEFHDKFSPDVEGDALCDCVMKSKDDPDQIRAICDEILKTSDEDPNAHFNAYTNHGEHHSSPGEVDESEADSMIDPLKARMAGPEGTKGNAAFGSKDIPDGMKPKALRPDQEENPDQKSKPDTSKKEESKPDTSKKEEAKPASEQNLMNKPAPGASSTPGASVPNTSATAPKPPGGAVGGTTQTGSK